jgi:hypothetical protein
MMMGRSKQDQLFRREIRALSFKWKMPELDRHSDILSRSTNPVILEARDAIEGGAQTLTSEAVRTNPVLLAILDQANAHKPPAGIVKIYRETNERALADDLWPANKPVMVAPIRDPFGEYDEAPHHTCLTFFRVGGDESGPQAGRLWTGQAWRKLKIGKENLYCEACYHKRVVRQVEQLIQEITQYPRIEDHGLVYAILPDDRVQKLIQTKSKQRQRKGEEFIYKVFPLDGGESVIVHNYPGGTPLPTTRKELFDLLYQWCQTPERRRIDGSTGFGGNYQCAKGDGRKKGDKDNKDQVGDSISITGFNYGAMTATARKAGLIPESKGAGRHRFNQRGGVTFDCTWPELIKALDTGKVLYKITEGAEALKRLLEECPDLSTVTASSPDTVTKSGQIEPTGGQDPPRTPEFDAVFGAQPA